MGPKVKGIALAGLLALSSGLSGCIMDIYYNDLDRQLAEQERKRDVELEKVKAREEKRRGLM